MYGTTEKGEIFQERENRIQYYQDIKGKLELGGLDREKMVKAGVYTATAFEKPNKIYQSLFHDKGLLF